MSVKSRLSFAQNIPTSRQLFQKPSTSDTLFSQATNISDDNGSSSMLASSSILKDTTIDSSSVPLSKGIFHNIIKLTDCS